MIEELKVGLLLPFRQPSVAFGRLRKQGIALLASVTGVLVFAPFQGGAGPWFWGVSVTAMLVALIWALCASPAVAYFMAVFGLFLVFTGQPAGGFALILALAGLYLWAVGVCFRTLRARRKRHV
jgi:hypothetical protein